MTDKTPKPDLDALFAELRAETPDPEPSDALMARIMADAADHMPRRVGEVAVAPNGRFWFQALGGWRGFGGLGLAAVTGLWIGAAPPAAVTTLSDTLWGGGMTVSLGMDTSFLVEEG